MRLLGNHERPEVGRLGHRTRGKSSTWARPRELRSLFVDKPEPGRLILGRAGGLHRRLLATEDCHSVLIYGPPGSHKTAGVVIPDILEWYGPLVSTSVKPDVLEATLQDRRARARSGSTTRSARSASGARSGRPSRPAAPGTAR
jgi:type IV secretory pathway TraG/TraD family ATPase VirD4